MRATVPVAVELAIMDFTEEQGIDEHTADALCEAAAEGALEVVNLLADMENEDARRKLEWLLLMIPSYWEEPQLRPEVRTRLLGAADE
jgi:hypothetical protein